MESTLALFKKLLFLPILLYCQYWFWFPQALWNTYSLLNLQNHLEWLRLRIQGCWGIWTRLLDLVDFSNPKQYSCPVWHPLWCMAYWRTWTPYKTREGYLLFSSSRFWECEWGDRWSYFQGSFQQCVRWLILCWWFVFRLRGFFRRWRWFHAFLGNRVIWRSNSNP